MPAFFLQRLFCVVHWQICKTKQITYKNKSDHIIMIWSDMLLYVIVFVLQICQCTKQNRRWRKKAGISPVPMMFCFESMAMGLWAEAVWTGLKHMCQHQSKPITSLENHKKMLHGPHDGLYVFNAHTNSQTSTPTTNAQTNLQTGTPQTTQSTQHALRIPM